MIGRKRAFDKERPVCYLIVMKVEWDGKTAEFETPMTILKLMKTLSLNRETYIPVVDNKMVTEDYKVEKDSKVRFIRVVSGG